MAAVPAGVCPGARGSGPAPAAPPAQRPLAQHCPPGPAQPAGASLLSGTVLGKVKNTPGGQRGVQHKGWGFWGHGRGLGCPSPLYHGTFSFCTSTGPTVSRWRVPSPGNAIGGYVQCSPAQVQEPSQDPKTTWGHPVPPLLPAMSPRRLSAAGQPVSQQWHGVLWTGSSALYQLGEERAELGGAAVGVLRLHHETHVVPPQRRCLQAPP